MDPMLQKWTPLRIALTIFAPGVLVLMTLGALAANADAQTLSTEIDPITRYVHITYAVPQNAPDEVVVQCSFSPAGKSAWRTAAVRPLISETGLRLTQGSIWNEWFQQGRIIERRAAGLKRTVIFHPYPEAEVNGRVDIDFRIELRTPSGKALMTHTQRIRADNSDVTVVEDWSQVMQRGLVAKGVEPKPGERKWAYRTGVDAKVGVSRGNALYGRTEDNIPLRQLTYPLELKGHYAVFVRTVAGWGSIRLRLTGDERTDLVASPKRGHEVLWQWRRMDRQHLVLEQPHAYTGPANASIDCVRFVPLTDELLARLRAPFLGKPDKLIAGYWEPYSWAFHSDVRSPAQHREPLSAYPEARIPIVDMQIGRFGMKVVYESRLTDQLIYATRGDPVPGDPSPETDNVGRMQQFTNTLGASLRYARELGFRLHANFGASNCYPGSPLQGDFSKKHPEWMRGSALRYEVPEVRAYALSLYREALEIGAEALSLDFCRYPETIDKVETANTFMQSLRRLAEEFGKRRGKHVPILVRFPGPHVRRWELFDYETWVREGWVDFLCPSNIQGRHLHIDPAPYLAAVRGSKCKLLPCVDGLSWGLIVPGPYLGQVARLYEAGVDGIYVYQADSRVLGPPLDRRTMRLLASSEDVRRWWERHHAMRPRCSKGIYLSRSSHPGPAYHRWERLRLWTEGVALGPMELYLDGKLVTKCDGPPYLLGTEDYASDKVVPPGKHELKVRVKDGTGWLEQRFTIQGA